jgi:two-component system, chemotaxis family, sensor kinase CheA
VVMPMRIGALRCGLPSHAVAQVARMTEVHPSATGPHVSVSLDTGDALVRLVSLHRLLNEPVEEQSAPLVVVAAHRGQYLAFPIDDYDSPRPMALQDRQQLPFQSDFLASAVPTPDGRVLLVLDLAPIFGAAGPEIRVRDSGGPASSMIKHVVVAEDAPVARELLCGILRSFGLRVTEAADGRQALAFAREKRPDLIMTDLEMPFMGGIELIEELKRDSVLRDVPVLVLTTRQDQQTRDRVRTLGVRGFLTKQKFVETQLRELVDACLESF